MNYSIRAYCRIPAGLKGRCPEGSCPELLDDLKKELSGAKEIHIAAYLFNNPIYADFIIELAKGGCKVAITSLPLRGYSTKPLKVNGYEDKISGQEMAKQVYARITATPNIQLRVFPHMYIWYGALYADGGASYSFHVKAITALFVDTKKCILSSGNFMFTDPLHSDNFIVAEGESEYWDVFSRFMADTEKNAIPLKKYDSTYSKPEDDFKYSFMGREINKKSLKSKLCFFTAPFYFINGDGSNHIAGKRIIEIIKSAKRRIWICAQHFHDVLSYDPEADSIMGAIYQKAQQQNLELRFLKQVPHSSLSDKRRAAITETIAQFVLNAEQRYNRYTHDKFIIIDDTLIVTTANYTPTQFAFGKRRMEMSFGGSSKEKKDDYFSEVNGFVIFPHAPADVLSQYENHFNALWDTGEDISISL